MADLLLLLETSGEHCSVAIAEHTGDSWQVLAEAEHTEPMKHTAMLLPLIKEAFAKTSYKLKHTSAVAVSTGPGSYTALRAGYSSAKGLCLALDIPMITVSTLRSIADKALQSMQRWEGGVVAVLPARRQDVYFAKYDASLNTFVAPACQEADENWWKQYVENEDTLLAGPTAQLLCAGRSNEVVSATVGLMASNLLQISTLKYTNKDFADTASVEPNYVKPPFITQAKPRFGS